MIACVFVCVHTRYSTCTSNHAWVSFEGFGEAYNDAFALPRQQGAMMSHYNYYNTSWTIALVGYGS